MNNAYLYIITALTVMGELRFLCGEDCGPRFQAGHFRAWVLDHARLFFLSVAIILLGVMLQRVFPVVRPAELTALLALPLAYWIARSRRWPRLYFFALFMLSAVVLECSENLSVYGSIQTAGSLWFLWGAARALAAGVSHQLFFSRLPRALSGTPMFLIAFAVVLLALQAIWVVLEPLYCLESEPWIRLLGVS